MENSLHDEVLQEIFQKLPSSSSSSVSLVCKRWLRLFRASRASLSLSLGVPPDPSLLPSLAGFLSDHPFLSSLSLSLSPHLLLPLLSLSLSLSSSFPRLTSLSLTLPRPILLAWLPSFPNLKHLTLSFSSDLTTLQTQHFHHDFQLGLPLESLSLVGLRADDWGLGCLYTRCPNLKNLSLHSCQGIGASYSSFVQCLQTLHSIQLRTCRSVVYSILMELLQHSRSLNSLLLHDGGNREGLLQFFSQCRSPILTLDLRLPLDLSNDHLSTMALSFRGLNSLRLQSCCLVSGEGLRALAVGLAGLEELALVNCDVVEREPGLLATLGQRFRNLRKLDLSHNEMLHDKELVSMLVSCGCLVELRVRGCGGLTSVALASMLRSCKSLESVDVMQCLGIGPEAVEFFLKNSSRLRRVEVEESKLSDAARMWASSKFVELVV